MDSSKKRGRSGMWQYFKMIAPDKVRCLLCAGEYKYHGNTSSMIRHFSTQHKALDKQGNTDQADQKQDPDEALVKMVVKNTKTFSLVDALLLSEAGERPKGRGRSVMWRYFKQITPEKVQCTVCFAELKYHGNTSTMVRHYSTKHGAAGKIKQKEHKQSTGDLPRVNPASQPVAAADKHPPPHKPSKKSEIDNRWMDGRTRELDEALVNMLVKDSQPLSIVDDCGFKRFVALLDPSYALPSQLTLEDMVIQRFNKQIPKVKDQP